MAKSNGGPPPIVVISDPHCGSAYGMCPPGMKTSNGNEILLNKPQQWLWNFWEAKAFPAIKSLGRGFTLIFNGDAIDGVHHNTTELVSHDPGDHFSIAVEFLRPVVKLAGKVYVVRGTESHVRNAEMGIARVFDAVPNEDTELPVWDVLNLPYGGGITRFVHHVGGGNYYASGIARVGKALEQHQIFAAAVRRDIPDVLVMGHCHQYWSVSNGMNAAATMPPLQLKTRYANKVVPFANNEVGICILYYTANDPIPDFRVIKEVMVGPGV